MSYWMVKIKSHDLTWTLIFRFACRTLRLIRCKLAINYNILSNPLEARLIQLRIMIVSFNQMNSKMILQSHLVNSFILKAFILYYILWCCTHLKCIGESIQYSTILIVDEDSYWIVKNLVQRSYPDAMFSLRWPNYVHLSWCKLWYNIWSTQGMTYATIDDCIFYSNDLKKKSMRYVFARLPNYVHLSLCKLAVNFNITLN